MAQKNKYGAVKTVVAGAGVFDSRKEARRYNELILLQRAGQISDLRRQVPFELIPAQYETVPRYGKDGKRLKDANKCVERSCVYYADFVYTDADGIVVVEDVKGVRSKDYLIKRKLMRYIYDIAVREV